MCRSGFCKTTSYMDFRGDPDFVRKRCFLTLHGVFLHLLNLSQSHCGATWQFLTAIGGPTCHLSSALQVHRRGPGAKINGKGLSCPKSQKSVRIHRWDGSAAGHGQIAAPTGLGAAVASKTFRSCSDFTAPPRLPAAPTGCGQRRMRRV